MGLLGKSEKKEPTNSENSTTKENAAAGNSWVSDDLKDSIFQFDDENTNDSKETSNNLPLPDDATIQEATQELIRSIFSAMASRKGQHWELTENEIKTSSYFATYYIKKIMPTSGEATIGVMGGGYVSGLLLKRLRKDRELKKGE